MEGGGKERGGGGRGTREREREREREEKEGETGREGGERERERESAPELTSLKNTLHSMRISLSKLLQSISICSV